MVERLLASSLLNILHSQWTCDYIIQVLNLYANDGERLFHGAMRIGDLAAGPLLLIGGMAYSISLIGIWALIGFFILLLMIPLQVRTLHAIGDRQPGDKRKSKHHCEIAGKNQLVKGAKIPSFDISQFQL